MFLTYAQNIDRGSLLEPPYWVQSQIRKISNVFI